MKKASLNISSQNEKKSGFDLFSSPGFKSFIAALICILIGLLIGFIVLLIIEPTGAFKAIETILKNFFTRNSPTLRLKGFGNTLVKTAPLILCSLSILFAYKAGLFNIGAAGQYVIGAGAALYCALGFGLPWYACLAAAVLAGALLGAISGTLKAYCNVNEVISCIMLNWISLYAVNSVLKDFCPVGYKDTYTLSSMNRSALLPTLGLNKLFGNESVTIAIPIAIIAAVLIWILLEKTRFGYEIKATGFNKNAAKYAGMREKQNIIFTMLIAGALAGLAAALMFLSGFMEWDINQSTVPAMGFNGIAAAFLGGLHPLGAIFSSYFIQHITDGGSSLDTRLYPVQIADLISALIIYLCGFVLFLKLKMNAKQNNAPKNAPLPTPAPADGPAPAPAEVIEEVSAETAEEIAETVGQEVSEVLEDIPAPEAEAEKGGEA